MKTFPGPYTLFLANGTLTLLSALFVLVFIKETAHLTDKEKKVLYAPPKYMEKVRQNMAFDVVSQSKYSRAGTILSKKTTIS